VILLERGEAGRRLAERLAECQLRNPVVMVMPPGAVRVGWEIAQRLNASMDVISALEVIVPGERGVRIGAVSEGAFVAGTVGSPAGNHRDADYVRRLVEFDAQRQAGQDACYRGGLPRLDTRNRDVVLVDDGWATPDMILAAMEAIRRRGAAARIFATPQCQTETYARVAPEVHLVSLYPREPSRSITLVDKSLLQLTPGETADLIRKSRIPAPAQVEPLMKAMPGVRAASQASNVA
jgi:putative phosphoribosyl transferase